MHGGLQTCGDSARRRYPAAGTLALRGGSGLGDALYIQAIARHLIGQGYRIEACSAWPDVFLPLGSDVTFSPFRRERIDRLCHYSMRRGIRDTTQFRDCCLQAGIREPVDLRLDWAVLNTELVGAIRRVAGRRPVILVQLPRSPMDRIDGYGDELLPDCRVIQRIIDRIGSRAFFVQIGKGHPLYRFSGIDFDLTGRTTVSDLIDVACEADACLGYVSFLVPLAESLTKPSLFVWSRKGLQSRNSIISALTPQKVIHRPDVLSSVTDDCSDEELSGAIDALLAKV